MRTLIEFVGTWTQQERALLTRMMERVEEAMELPAWCETTRAPWTCCLEVSSGERLMIVSRAFLPGTCVAHSIKELGDQLIQLAAQPVEVPNSGYM